MFWKFFHVFLAVSVFFELFTGIHSKEMEPESFNVFIFFNYSQQIIQTNQRTIK